MKTLKYLVELLFPMAKQVTDRIFYNIVEDKQVVNINDMSITFFDIQAKKDKQFGFIINNDLIFCGDEPLQKSLFDLGKVKEWLLHESFCLDSEKDRYKPHQKGHCTVKEASITAQTLKVKNLVLFHTQDNDLNTRKNRYSTEAKEYFSGNVLIPDDLEIIDL